MAIVLGLGTASAHAETIEGRLQLGLHSTLLSHDSATLEGDGGKMSYSSTSSGLMSSTLGIQLGYGVSDRWLIGGRLAVGSTTQTLSWEGAADDAETTGSSYLLTPRVAYLLSDGEHFKPYLAATLGLRGQSTTSEASSSSASLFVYGAELGAHAFAAGGVSIDPSITVVGLRGQQTFEGEETSKMDHSGFALLLGVTLSGWFGEGPPRPAVDEASAEFEAAGPDEAGYVADAAPAQAPVANTLAFNEDGSLRLDVGLGPGRLRLIGRPAVNGSRVIVQLVPRFDRGECTEASVRASGSEAPLTFAGQRAVGTHAPEFLITIPQLRSLIESDSAAVVACEGPWKLDARERGYVSTFLERFRERAIERRTWTELEPAPAAPEPQAVDAPATP